jgi:hypothetical protein
MNISKIDERESAIILATYHIQRAKIVTDGLTEAARGPGAQKIQTALRVIVAELGAATNALASTQRN